MTIAKKISKESPTIICCYVFSIVALILSIDCHSQIVKVDKATADRDTETYLGFVHTKETIYALSNHAIISWSKRTLQEKRILLIDSADNILSIGKNSRDEIYFGTEKGSLCKLNTDSTAILLSKLKYAIKYIVFNSFDKMLLIVPNAIYDPITTKYWNKFHNHTSGIIVKNKRGKIVDTYFQMPQYVFVDSKDKLWMIASFGEFGGDLQIFDTQKLRILDNKKVDSINRDSFFPKSVFEGANGNIFITSGLQHFSNSSTIYSIDRSMAVKKIFESHGRRQIERKTGKVLDEGGLFVGAGAYNKADWKIYFATERGIYTADILIDKLVNVKLLINPSLTFSREPLAIGVGMPVIKLDFLEDGRMIFLSRNDGIGVYDGKSVTMLR